MTDFGKLTCLRRRTREEIVGFAHALNTLDPSHPRTLEQGALVMYALDRQLEALERTVRAWEAAIQRQIRRDLIVAERDAREWLLKYPDEV